MSRLLGGVGLPGAGLPTVLLHDHDGHRPRGPFEEVFGPFRLMGALMIERGRRRAAR